MPYLILFAVVFLVLMGAFYFASRSGAPARQARSSIETIGLGLVPQVMPNASGMPAPFDGRAIVLVALAEIRRMHKPRHMYKRWRNASSEGSGPFSYHRWCRHLC